MVKTILFTILQLLKRWTVLSHRYLIEPSLVETPCWSTIGWNIFIILLNFFWNKSLQSRCKYFTNDPRHSIYPESDVGDYHTRSARCVGLNCKLSGQKHSRFVFGPLENIHDAHRNRWLPAKWWVDTLWVFPALVGGHGGVSIMSGWLLRQQLHRMWSCRGMKCVKYWIWAFVFTKRPIFFLY